MSKTKAHTKDGRLVILTSDATEPGMTTLPLDQASAGTFELAAQPNATTALLFKPAGRKTADTLATYRTRDKAEKALRAIFTAMSGTSTPVYLRVLKWIGIVVGALLVLWIVLSIAVALFGGPSTPSAPAADQTGAAAVPADDTAPLPVGTPFPLTITPRVLAP